MGKGGDSKFDALGAVYQILPALAAAAVGTVLYLIHSALIDSTAKGCVDAITFLSNQKFYLGVMIFGAIATAGWPFADKALGNPFSERGTFIGSLLIAFLGVGVPILLNFYHSFVSGGGNGDEIPTGWWVLWNSPNCNASMMMLLTALDMLATIFGLLVVAGIVIGAIALANK